MQKLTRHSDIRLTMNTDGDAMTADMREAHSKVVSMATSANGSQNGSQFA